MKKTYENFEKELRTELKPYGITKIEVIKGRYFGLNITNFNLFTITVSKILTRLCEKYRMLWHISNRSGKMVCVVFKF